MSILFADDGASLRRRVIAELQGSPSLWQEYRRRRKRWWTVDIQTQRFFAFFLFVVIPVASRDLTDPALFSEGPRRLSALLALAVTGRAFTLAVETWNVLFNNVEFGATSYLPVRPENYFLYQIQKLVFRSLWIPLLAAVSCVVLVRGSGRALLLVLPVAMLNWVVLFALSLFIVRYGRTYLGLNSLPGYAFYMIAALIVSSAQHPSAVLIQFYRFSALLPSAWIDAGFQYSAQGERSLALLMFLPSIALAASVAWNYVWLKKTFLSAVATALPVFPSPVELPDESGESDDKPVESVEDRTAWTRARAELQGLQAARSIEKGSLATRIDWADCGPIERCAGLWFTERERTVAEFLLGEHIGWWSQRWKQSAIVTAAVVLGALGGIFPPLLLLVGGIVSMLIGCPMAGGYWLAFSPGRSGGLNIPMLAMAPAGFREVSGIVVKSGALRLAAWLPLGLLAGMTIGYTVGEPESGVAVVMYAVYAVLAFQPMAAAVRFTGGTSYLAGGAFGERTLRRLMCAGLSLGLRIGFGLSAVATVLMIFSDSEIVHGGIALTLPVWSLVFWRWSAFLFHHGYLDQVTTPRR